MLDVSGYRYAYQISHEIDESKVFLQIFIPKSVIKPTNSLQDIAEDLADLPHQLRRSFTEKVHNLYSFTKNMEMIRAGLIDDSYFEHLEQLGYIMKLITLFVGKAESSHYYCLFVDCK